jgi:type I restriction-modification system DNA methylase subunit
MFSKDAGRERVKELVSSYRHNRSHYIRSDSNYNETQVRVDFINPLLKALGWDVYNEKQAPQHLREVIHEDVVNVEENEEELQTKMPDYALRLGTERKFFLEAKRPSVAIEMAPKPAFQVRRYGWNAQLPISVLTNFDKLVLYDCIPRPRAGDPPQIARLKVYDHTEYVEMFDEIYDQISREAVYSGRFDALFAEEIEREGAESFDQYFLDQIQSWRELLAGNLIEQNPNLTSYEVNFLVQRLLNRIIFLRICEDRAQEKYQALKEITTYDELKELFLQADRRYNSELFDFIEDELSLHVTVDSEILVGIFRELYYPESPYAFSVVESSVLGEIYELFLGKEIRVADHNISLVEKPEVVASRGVVPTPRYIVDRIIHYTLDPLCNGKAPEELTSLRVADIACGSGSFLLAAYDYLLHHYLDWYVAHNPDEHSSKVREAGANVWQLTLAEKKRILTTHIFGVDFDVEAVEVARFSLLLRVLENENAASIKAHMGQYHERVLPNLTGNIQYGNSLVDSTYFEYDPDALLHENHISEIRPLDWQEAFTEVMAEGGFSALVGNPPYIRIQNMVQYSPEEVKYYQSSKSPYRTSQRHNFDKYSLFIERGLSLLREDGRLGYIVPHKFFTIRSGQALRELLSSGQHLSQIVHFGVEQVFGSQRTTYTCLLILSEARADEFTVEYVHDLDIWRQGESGNIEAYLAGYVGEKPWLFAPPAARALFERLETENQTTLGQVADIFVGLQTSADTIYILKPVREAEGLLQFVDRNGEERVVERSIVRPCLLDVTLTAFSRPVANSYIIFPYRIVGNKAQVYTQEEMKEYFPHCWKYFQAFQEQLLQRNISPFSEDTWYRYGRSQSLAKFNGEHKLIWPVLGLEARYAYDDQDVLFTGGGNGPYYGLRPLKETQESIYYLQAVLSHPVIEAIVLTGGSPFRGGYKSHGKQFVQDLPVRRIDFADAEEKATHDEIVQLVQQLIQTKVRLDKANLPHQKLLHARHAHLLRQRVEARVSQLYRITDHEIAVVQPLFPGEGDE